MYPALTNRFSAHRADIGVGRWRLLIGLIAILTAGSGIVMIDSIPLDSHEIFVAQTTHEMAVRGDWLVPYFNEQPRLNKPPLSYWAAALLAKVAGDLPTVCAWHVRLISVLAGLGVLGCTVLNARLLFDRTTGLVAGALLASSAGMFSFMHDARPDMLYAFWISLMIAAAAGLVHASTIRGRGTEWLAVTLWLSAGLATLTKGPHIPIVVLVGIALGLRQTLGSWRRTRSLLRPVLGSVLVLAVCVPWWWLLQEHLDAARVESSQLGGTLLVPALSRLGNPYYLYRPLQLLLPWLPVIFVALVGYRRPVARQGISPLVWPLLLTVAALSTGQQFRFFYLLPLLGVLSILVARPWVCSLRAILPRPERGLILGAFVLQIVILFGCAGWVIQQARGTAQFGLIMGLLVASVGSSYAVWRLVPGPRTISATVAMAVVMIVLWSAAAVTGALWDRERYAGHRLARLAATELAPATTLAAYGVSPTVYVYTLKRRVPALTNIAEVDGLIARSRNGDLGLVLRGGDVAGLAARYAVTELGRYRRGDADDVLVVLHSQASPR